jgi:beta-phosphoglucomutase
MGRKLTFKPKAVIFDMDGVIVDSMPYHFIAWYEALRPYGIRFSCLEVYKREGEKWDKTLPEMLRKHGIEPTEELMQKIIDNRTKIFKKYFNKTYFSGAIKLLEWLKRKNNLSLAIVTATTARDIKKILDASLRRRFKLIITGDQVKYGKPFPHPYLQAAKALGIKPEEAVVIENSPFGVRSAKAAGMFCIALTTSLPRKYLKKADIVVDDFAEIQSILARV